MIAAPLSLKLLVPGYRARWRDRYACLLQHLREIVPRLAFGQDGHIPWIQAKDGGPRFHGFRTEPKNLEVLRILGDGVPAAMPREHFRLVKDYITRYLYPHMRPDLKPDGFPVERMFGFHGQHKDTIADLDPACRDELTAAFTAAPDDVIIDCGAFLGFGELRLSPDLPGGHIYAVEASAKCFALLERNLEFNGIANATPVHRAVWNEETMLDLESDFAQANTLVAEVHKGTRTQKVRAITVDGVVARYGLEKLDMLSLTLNGAEVEALAGAGHTLDALRPRIRLAGWYSRGGRKIWELTQETLEGHGYRVFVGPRGSVLALPGGREPRST